MPLMLGLFSFPLEDEEVGAKKLILERIGKLLNGRMDDMAVFNSISVISAQWGADYERYCSVNHHLGLDRLLHPA